MFTRKRTSHPPNAHLWLAEERKIMACWCIFISDNPNSFPISFPNQQLHELINSEWVFIVFSVVLNYESFTIFHPNFLFQKRKNACQTISWRLKYLLTNRKASFRGVCVCVCKFLWDFFKLHSRPWRLTHDKHEWKDEKSLINNPYPFN